MHKYTALLGLRGLKVLWDCPDLSARRDRRDPSAELDHRVQSARLAQPVQLV